MPLRVPPSRSLRVSPCRSLCDWRATRTAGPRLFACAGCGSQWDSGEPWSPRQADGTVPSGVREELTSAPPADAAGNGGS